jgi:hypothetical protein
MLDGSGASGNGKNGKSKRSFFEKGRRAADAGQYNFAIELFLTGLAFDPDNVLAHKELRTIALKRKAGGGEDLGSFQKMLLKTRITTAKDEMHAMLTAEQLLAYDPGNIDVMLDIARHAKQAGLHEVATWSERLARVSPGPR